MQSCAHTHTHPKNLETHQGLVNESSSGLKLLFRFVSFLLLFFYLQTRILQERKLNQKNWVKILIFSNLN